jgi:hypothetical protein
MAPRELSHESRGTSHPAHQEESQKIRLVIGSA